MVDHLHPYWGLPAGNYGAILADPPWHFEVWEDKSTNLITGRSTRRAERHYSTMTIDELSRLPVSDLAGESAVLFTWVTWPLLESALNVIASWGFIYKTCGFCWVKANAKQIDMFREDIEPRMNLGWWTRSNSEVCLLATRGKPKRRDSGVRQAIIEPQREHSRKPDGIHERIERLVAGPYVELFARQKRKGWDCWGNQTDKFEAVA